MRQTTIMILLITLYGCKDENLSKRQDAAFKACIDSGGVPVQAWFSERALGDCIYKPVSVNSREE